ncbi:MAG: bifunctional (p)ppGpp synthetase/guanosine-3',5'-bis(diphosphate) 3'-pyrophosphohydrolase [Gammaproteobacteria bacterium]|nr:bifunctional (p)ppGpp synthetase/guanosine-3',5'-bis(diphosphate) 3'-pyrophosphohydrolase [Gammaproteobacteria bacterium]
MVQHSGTTSPDSSAHETPMLAAEQMLKRFADSAHMSACLARLGDAGYELSEHGVGIARILEGLRLDADTLAAGLLLPLLQAHRVQPEQVADCAGPRVALLLRGFARLHQFGEDGVPASRGMASEAENLRRMLLALSDDVRVVLLALAERLQVMRTLKHRPEAERRAVAQETLGIYAPLANRLGIGQLKWELEDYSLRFLEPETYKDIATLLDEKRIDREAYIRDLVARIEAELAKAAIPAKVYGRPKHIYSIWKKMQRKGLGFHELYDVRAVRVLVDNVSQCYAVLGQVHALWQPIAKEFDDYIARPKGNNYQSLHTAVVGPEGKVVEIQIRTHAMHQHAELGVAAHWKYKEGGSSDPGFERKVNALRALLDGDESQDDATLLEKLQSNDDERIYVMTPAGKVIDLPQRATPVDFAYAIHTEVGHRCRGAKVNGQIVPLTYALENGQSCEILTAKQGGPSRDWLSTHSGYVHTNRARYRIRQWWKQQDMERNIADGRSVLERELRRLGASSLEHDKLAARLKQDSVEAMLAAIGRADIGSGHLSHAIADLCDPPERKDDEAALLHKPTQPSRPGKHGDIKVAGVGNLMTRMAPCCKPVPGDAIIGYITRGQGVTIHKRDCTNVINMNDEERLRLIEVSWESDDSDRRVYPVDIEVEAYDRTGLLKDITVTLSDAKINVIAVNTRSDKNEHVARMTLTLEIADNAQLTRVLERIGQLPNVSDVRRKR